MSKEYLNKNNYKFQKDIGEGNFGKVKLATFILTGEEFAIKVLNKDKIKEKMKNTIFQENEIITRFNHINIVYVYLILEDKNNYYIIMEYCKHGELFDYIVKNQKLSEKESSIFFYQLINGVEYIHKKGISHRDLKPENLLLAENNMLKIIDFGLSHEFGGDELLKTKCGSPSYAAPEIICCPLYDGFKVDIWCCGIILYAMLCGYLPFEGDNNDILFANILECNPELPNFLSDVSKDILKKILTINPDYRISLEEIKRHEFYLMGKKYCNIDYNSIENNIIKKRKMIFSQIKEENNKQYISTISSNSAEKNLNKDSSIIDNSDIKFCSIKNDNSYKAFHKKIMDISSKYSNRGNKINTFNNRIQQILNTDVNDFHTIQKPYKNNIKIINNNNYNKNHNKFGKQTNINTQYNNYISNYDKNILNEIMTNLKSLKNSLYFKVIDSSKNKYSTINKSPRISIPKYNSHIEYDKINDKNFATTDNNTRVNHNRNFLTKNLKKNSNKYCVSQKNNDKISYLTNENIYDENVNNYYNTHYNYDNCHKRYNSFKDSLNVNLEKQLNTNNNLNNNNNMLNNYTKNNTNNLNNNYFNSFSDKSTRKNSAKQNLKSNNANSCKNITIRKSGKNKDKTLNLFSPTSTLFYNNININIKEININPKKNEECFSYISLSPPEKNRNRINTCNRKEKIKNDNKLRNNKTIYSCVNTTRKILSANNRNTNTKKVINFNRVNNEFKNYPYNNLNTNNYTNDRTMKFVFNEKNIPRDKLILSTEPKDLLTFKNYNPDVEQSKYKYIERKNNKCMTLNTEESKLNTKNKRTKVEKNKKRGNSLFRLEKAKENNKKLNNNFDEMFLLMLMEQKTSNKVISRKNSYNYNKKIIK